MIFDTVLLPYDKAWNERGHWNPFPDFGSVLVLRLSVTKRDLLGDLDLREVLRKGQFCVARADFFRFFYVGNGFGNRRW